MPLKNDKSDLYYSVKIRYIHKQKSQLVLIQIQIIMLTKNILNAHKIYKTLSRTTKATVSLQLFLNNSASTLYASKKMLEQTNAHSLKAKNASYTFSTEDHQGGKNVYKKNFIDRFGFSLDIEDFKVLPLLDKISLYLKIIKLNNETEMEIEELDKITKIKQVFIQELNILDIHDQLEYYNYFISAYKLWLYRQVSSPYSQKQTQIQQFRKLVPKIQSYFSTYKFDTDSQTNLSLITTLLANLECISESESKVILSAAVPFLKKLNKNILSIFLADASSNSFDFPKEFFDELYGNSKGESLEWPYIYYFFTFADKYSHFYAPLINFQKTSSKCRKIFEQENVDIKEIFCFLEMIKISYKLINEPHLKTFNSFIYYSLLGLERQIQDKKYPIVDVLKICNELTQICPIGTRFLREISLNKDTRYSQEYIPIFKEYILNQMRNLQPTYIYSIDQQCVNEVSIPMLFLLQLMIKKIIVHDPYFLLQLPNFYQAIGEKIRNSLGIGTNQCLKRISKNFYELDKQDRQLPQSIALTKKMLNFISHAKDNWPNFIQQCDIFISEAKIYLKRESKKIDPKDNEMLLFVYQTINLMKYGNRDQMVEVCENICIKYISEVMYSKQSSCQTEFKINSRKSHQQHIVQILSLFNQDSSLFTTENKVMITQFLNTKFIYSVKSVRKQAIFDVLRLCEHLQGVDVNLLGFLYNNLSSFVIFTQVNKKFYFPRGPKSLYKERLLSTLRRAMKNYKMLRKIRQKDRLNILKIMALRFWNELTTSEILKLLIIFGSPAFLNDKIKQKLKEVKFSKECLSKISELDTLRNFRFHNTQLFKLLQYEQTPLEGIMFHHEQIQNYDLTELNYKSPEDLSLIFLNLQFYEQVLEDARITCQENIPAPQTSSQKINSIYVCLKIFEKIRKVFDFRIKNDSYEKNRSSIGKIINIQEEIKFIKSHNLVKLDQLNEFKLGNIEILGNQTMIEGWYSYEAQDNLIEIQDFSNVGETQDNPYEKVLLSLFGDTGYIRQYTKHQTFLSDLVFTAFQLNLQAQPKGSYVQIFNPKNKQDAVHVLCSNQSNYKIHTIFAYILTKIGLDAHIVTSSNTRDQLMKFLIQRFKLGEDYLVGARQGKRRQIEEQDIQEKEKKEEEIVQLSDGNIFYETD